MVEGSFVTSIVENQRAFGADSATMTVDLPRANYLQGILIRVENVNGSTSNTGATIESDIDKIEVIANGTVVYSATGEMCRKFEQFDRGQLPPADESQVGSATQFAVFPIKFGTHDFDKNVCLPSWSFSTLQLKITCSFTDNTTTGWTTSESSALCSVIIRQLVPAAGQQLENTPFLDHLEAYSRTITTTGLQDVELPVGAGNGALRRLMMSAYEAGIDDGVDISTITLLLNESQRVVDELWNTSQAEDDMRYRATTKKQVKLMKANGETYASKVSRIKNVSLTLGATCCNQAYYATPGGDTFAVQVINVNGIASATAQQVSCTVEGPGVSYATMLDLGTADLRDCLNLSREAGVSSLKLRYNQAAAGSTNTVVVERLRRF